MKKYSREPQDKTWLKEWTVEGVSGCWNWMGAVHKKTGYGIFRRKGGSSGHSAHRMAWELWNGPVPEGLCVCHKCDNPRCCNPDHLFIGTHKDNSEDMVRKGRHGAKTTMTKEMAEQIINYPAGLEATRLRFGVGQITVWRLRHGVHTIQKSTAVDSAS